ncbi:MAG: murein biosynthesis integral membrane protein MurJ [Solirubrobacteraceae bacterium]
MSNADDTHSPEPGALTVGARRRRHKRVSENTAIFAVATALSRLAGVVRESLAGNYFGTSKAMSAFTIASLIPNLMSNLFAQSALSAAFVPVFTDLLQQGRRREAFRLATTLFWIVMIVLGAITAIGVVLSGLILPLFTGGSFDGDLAGALAQIMFPVVLALGLTGVLTGILQSYDEFSIPALAPVLWNIVILVGLVALHNSFGRGNGIYAYAVAWLVAAVVQFFLVASALRRIDYRLSLRIEWQDPRIRQVFTLMLPVTIGLGILNLDALLNSIMGALVRTAQPGAGPSAIRYAFLLYMLPQGIFSVAVATVLFPTLSRQAARAAAPEMRHSIGNGMRQIMLLLIPAAAGLIVLARPITRLVFMRGQFGLVSLDLTSEALFWFAFSLPFAGLNLLLTRTFFALQRPWLPTRLAAINIAVDIIVSVGLYKPLGIAGLVIGTATANVVMFLLQFRRLRSGFNGYLEEDQSLMIAIRLLLASILTAVVARVVWSLINSAAGASIPGQIVSVGAAVLAALGFYVWLISHMRIPEWGQIEAMVAGRLSAIRGQRTP